MKRFAQLLVLAMLCLPAVGSFPLLADEGRIPIVSLAAAPPYVINTPGDYILTEDVTFAGTIIVIQSNQVTVDLNGFNLTGGGGLPAILIDTAFATFFVTIRNGTIRGGSHGIDDNDVNRTRVRIEDLTVDSMDLRGISIDKAAHAEIERCHVRNIFGDDGIFVSGFSTVFNGRFVDNEVVAVGGFGMRIDGLQGGEVRRNITTLFGFNAGSQAGIKLGDVGAGPGAGAGANIIEENTAVRPQGVAEEGIHLTSCDGNLIENNTVKGNQASGIRLEDSSNNKLHENVAQGNIGNGMDTTGITSNNNFFLENVAGNNGGNGIDCAGGGDNLRGNMIRGDGVGALCVDAGGNIL
jgi:parallel beta-helix repeat protein